jgi:hypothetical protein
MAININPNRINSSAGNAGKAGERRTQAAQQESVIPKPQRAHVNIIPEPESLATLIRGAVAALRKGMIWDRGTMVNLLV